jgi:hypothetical protein
LGTFLFLLAILIPFLRSFDRSSLVASLFLSLAAFYTKPYFLLAFGVVFSYLFLFVSGKKGLLYGMFFLLAFVVVFLGIRSFLPLYFIDTVVGNISNTYTSADHVLAQLRSLFLFFYPMLFFLLVLSLAYIRENGLRLNISSNLMNLSGLDAPLLNCPINYLFYSFISSAVAFLFILGPHVGNYLNYAYQLVVPTFFCWLFYEMQLNKNMKYFFAGMMLFNLALWSGKVLNADMLKQADSQEWASVHEYLGNSSVTLNSPATTAEIIALGQIPMDSGQTAYFYAVEPFSGGLFTAINYDEFYNDGFRYTLLVDRMIEKQRFDLVITTREKTSFYHDRILQDYYDQIDEIEVDMPQTNQHWTLVFWKPLAK